MRALLAAPLCAVAAALLALAADTPCAGPALGLLLDPSDAVLLPSEPADEPGLRPLVRLEADWERIEAERGSYDWSAHDAAIEHLAAAGFEVALALGGKNPLYLDAGQVPSPLVAGSLEGWLAFVRGAVRRFHGRVLTFEIGDDPRGAGFDADTFALVLKHSALAVRAEASALGARVLVATAATPAGDLEWLGSLWERDVAAYVDVLPVAVDAAAGPAAAADATRAVLGQSLLHPPAAAVWTYVVGSSDWDAPAAAVTALAAGAAVAAFEPLAEHVPWTIGLQELLGGYAPAPEGRLRLHYSAGEAPERARVLGSFFHARDFRTLVVFEAPPTESAEVETRLIVDSRTLRNVRVVDPTSGIVRRAGVDEAPDGSGDRALRVRPAEGLQAAIFEKQAVNPGFEVEREELDVGAVRSLTAEEIISRHQQVQREQDDRLERWTAKGRIDFHFKLAQGGSTVDVSIDSNYFWERGGELEWEQVQYYVNGNKVTWKKIPELPLIQPEKVVTLPLDLTLNRTYAYRLVGEDNVGERSAYVLEFQPVDPDSALSFYRGRIWIDKTEFVRLKVSLIQNNLEPPVLSNEEVDLFRELTATDGQRYWMLDDIDGQQIWNAAGRSFVVRREVSFLEYQINPAALEFASRRAQAYASHNQMLRETQSGFRYLERQADGSRTVKEGMDTSQLFAAAGAFKDNSQDQVLPLAGVNYFNYDLGGKNIQLNVLFAGLFASVTASKPDLFGGAIDLTADANLSAFKSDDRVFVGDEEIDAERIARRGQSLALRLGVPAGQFFKMTFIGRAGFNQYFADDDAPGTLPDFVLPQDHVELSGGFEAAFNRRGYSLSASGRWARRSEWEPWGLPATPSEPLEDSYARYGLSAFKEWYLPKFQKIRGSVDLLDGSSFDRFSRYQFSFFGEERLSGFSGSGVRFDRGAIGRAGYSFNLFEVVRFDATVETARVEEEDSTVGQQSFSGLGLTANFVAPWKTVVNLSWGYALDSDIPDLEGQQEFLLLVFKLF